MVLNFYDDMMKIGNYLWELLLWYHKGTAFEVLLMISMFLTRVELTGLRLQLSHP